MKTIATAISAGALALSMTSVNAAEITGAGASFPAPVYSKWADAYYKETGNKVNYQSIGSGGGIKQISAKTVDFGASDMPLKPEDLKEKGLMQFPTVIGGVVPVVNLQGVAPGQMKLSAEVLANIYLNKITKWNDKAIVALNPGVNLPDQDISVIRRADGSGTTFIFTNYLSKVSADWKSTVGEGTAVKWPVGLGGKGNEGVSAFVQRVPGSIGYVEYAYAKQNKLTHTQLNNAEGAFVQPSEESFKAAAAGASWSNSFYEILTQQPGKAAWPITGATFILFHTEQADAAKASEVLKFFNWAYAKGDKLSSDLDYVPLPDETVKKIEAAWKTVKATDGKAISMK
ncbi:phosphate ABC transporter substrate-binding protein PstS [Limnobacter sp.]|uniref:phosphate ABC transporter substrate-binding protein PstS n=1 Tax=Limnobacter sp. TaxID=2003368 RepID=UPI0025BEC61C|nr:phosphate ABC transporter substrate-binding protein PstS [Limnobacter sp.]